MIMTELWVSQLALGLGMAVLLIIAMVVIYLVVRFLPRTVGVVSAMLLFQFALPGMKIFYALPFETPWYNSISIVVGIIAFMIGAFIDIFRIGFDESDKSLTKKREVD